MDVCPKGPKMEKKSRSPSEIEHFKRATHVSTCCLGHFAASLSHAGGLARPCAQQNHKRLFCTLCLCDSLADYSKTQRQWLKVPFLLGGFGGDFRRSRLKFSSEIEAFMTLQPRSARSFSLSCSQLSV